MLNREITNIPFYCSEASVGGGMRVREDNYATQFIGCAIRACWRLGRKPGAATAVKTIAYPAEGDLSKKVICSSVPAKRGSVRRRVGVRSA